MKKRLMTMIAAAVFLSVIVVPSAFGDDTDDGPEPPVDVDITARIIATPDLDTTDTVRIYRIGSDGKETLEFTGPPRDEYTLTVEAPCKIRFEVIGYAIKAYIYNGKSSDGYILDIGTDDDTVGLYVIMVQADEVIGGIVRWRNGNPVGGGVIVEAYDPVGEIIYRGVTDGSGRYSIECPIGGRYIVSVNHPVYESDPAEIDRLMGPVVHDFVLTPKKGATYLFELDLTHSLMVIGGMVGLFLLIFIILYRIHIDRNPESSKIHSDPRKKDQK
jgi:hypothetical protein